MSSSTKMRLKRLVFSQSSSIPHLHLFGTRDSGAEDVLRELIEKESPEIRDWEIVKANCLYADGSFKVLLQSLSDQLGLKKIDNIDDFSCNVRTILEKSGKRRLMLVLFDSDALLKMPASSMNALLCISKTIKCATVECVRVVTVSERMWEFAEQNESVGSLAPVQVSYSESQDENSLIEEFSATLDVDIQLVRIVISVVHSHTLDKNLLRKFIFCANKNLMDRKQEFDASDRMGRSSILNKCVTLAQNSVERKECLLDQECSESALSLPISLRLLLVAAFCACHNTPASDKRFFLKLHGKEKRNETRERASDLAATQKEQGPKSVDAQRIAFIHASLLRSMGVEGDKLGIPHLVDVYPQLCTLVCMALLSRASCAANLDQPKYRCLVAHDVATRMAESLKIDLSAHLEHNF